MREVSGPSEVNPLHNIIISTCSLDPPPKIISLEFVLVTQLEHAGLKRYDLLNGQGLTDSVDKLQLGGYALDLHINISYIKLDIDLNSKDILSHDHHRD